MFNEIEKNKEFNSHKMKNQFKKNNKILIENYYNFFSKIQENALKN